MPATFDIDGSLAMHSKMVVGRSSDDPAGGMCLSLISQASFSDDTQMTVLDAAGTIAGVAVLGKFTFIEEADGTKWCVRGFTVADVPEGKYFQLKLGDVTSDVVSKGVLIDPEFAWTFS